LRASVGPVITEPAFAVLCNNCYTKLQTGVAGVTRETKHTLAFSDRQGGRTALPTQREYCLAGARIDTVICNNCYK
jgi:hypothetical protein